MTMIEANWAEALEPGIREWFYNGYMGRPAMAPMFFNVQSSTKYQEHFHSFGGITLDAWDHYRNNRQVAEVNYDPGYKTTLTAQEFSVDFPVERSLIEDNLYGDVLDPVKALGDSAMLKRETDGASVFNNATSASFLGADGVALLSNSHPNSPSASGTQDNLGALSLTAANLETVRLAMMAFKDDRNNLAGIIPDLLIVPPALENTAKELVMTPLQVDSANNNINPQFGRFQYVTWHYLTDTNRWYVVDSIKMKQSLYWFNRIPTTIALEPSKVTSTRAVYNARMRYSYGWRDWRWIYGSEAS